jgi:magnesium chelatase family protein
MLARTHAFTIDGLQARHVHVEVDVRSGLPAFTIVGLADVAVREARERIQAAIRNAGYEFPGKRITANLAPGDLPKAGPGLDVALACAVLAASGQLASTRLDEVALFGELALDGTVRACQGTLAVAEAAQSAGLSTLALAPSRAHEAALIEGLEIAATSHLRSVVRVLEGGASDPCVQRSNERQGPAIAEPELADVHGQRYAIRALLIAAAGGHSCLFSGPPGSGKTMLAQRVAGILPPLTRAEAIEVSRIHSLAGTAPEELMRRRPFRSPHHSITSAGLIGGSQRGRVGEIVLAHNGVLFLDELTEFARPTLESLRQPLEERRIAISRSRHSTTYPARFMLLAATNPCPCGYAGEGERCACSESEIARYRQRLSGPLLDRMDLFVNVQRPRRGDRSSEAPTITSAEARERVRLARERQQRRLLGSGISLNVEMDARLLGVHITFDEDAEQLWRRVHEQTMLSMRGEHRVLKVARTIADLNARERIGARELGSALALRAETARASTRAA